MATKINPTGGQTYRLLTSVTGSGTTITLASFKEPVSNTAYTMAYLNADLLYGTIEPQSTHKEFISFTGITQNADGTATLTGVTRGLSPSYPYTSSATYQQAHPGQSIFILSNPPQLYKQYAAKASDETITGQWTFTATPITPPAVSDASISVKGVSYMSVAPASAASPTAVGTNDSRVPVAYAADAGGTDDYVITPSPAITAYSTGQIITFKANTANTGACTLNVNSLGAKTIKKYTDQDLTTNDILAGQLVQVVYDGTNFQLQSKSTASPIVRTYTSTTVGDTTTRFDVTNITGTTYRYTYDGTGTDPNINSGTFPIGTVVDIQASNMSAGNKGVFTTTGVGSNYFEVTNASGVAENDKTIGTGYISKGSLWSKPAGLRYVVVEVQAAGGGSGGTSTPSSGSGKGSAGAGGGGYAKKKIDVATLNATEQVTIGPGGASTINGGNSAFGAHCSAVGGSGSATDSTTGASGGSATGGDININGQQGGNGYSGSTSSTMIGGQGGSSTLGLGGSMNTGQATTGKTGSGYGSGASGSTVIYNNSGQGGASGTNGIVIVTEYY